MSVIEAISLHGQFLGELHHLLQCESSNACFCSHISISQDTRKIQVIFFGLLDALITLWYVILQEETHTVMKLTMLPNIPADSFYSGEKN